MSADLEDVYVHTETERVPNSGTVTPLGGQTSNMSFYPQKQVSIEPWSQTWSLQWNDERERQIEFYFTKILQIIFH